MISKFDKNADRVQRHARVRKKISGTAETPRFNVYRSTNNISVQIIDDVKGHTLVACSTLDMPLRVSAARAEGPTASCTPRSGFSTARDVAWASPPFARE